MKNCEYCNYFKIIESSSASDNTQRAICLFTDTMLLMDQDRTGMEYLCRNSSYQEYQSRRATNVNLSKLKNEDWRLVYKMRHKVPAQARITALAKAIL